MRVLPQPAFRLKKNMPTEVHALLVSPHWRHILWSLRDVTRARVVDIRLVGIDVDAKSVLHEQLPLDSLEAGMAFWIFGELAHASPALVIL